MTDTKELTTNCPFCLDLKPTGSGELSEIPYEEFVTGISQNSCPLCRVLVTATRAFAAQFLADEGHFGARPGTKVFLTIGDDGVVCIIVSKDGWSAREGRFQLYWTEDMPRCVELGGPLRDIAAVAGDLSMWEFLRSCLHDCIGQHSLCGQQQKVAWFPKRLLVVEEPRTDFCQLRLVETEEEPPQSHYVALSHCWGGEAHICATKSNISRLRDYIGVDELPRTFQDCVTVAREFDVRYIWIDSLCIVQDDRTDWSLQSQHMDKVFQNALFTVAAVMSPNSSVPYLGPDAPTIRGQCQAISIHVGRTSRQMKARDREPIEWGDSDSINEPLHERAWAWQERWFSPRTISFLQQKVEWNCKIHTCCESGTVEKRSDFNVLEGIEDPNAAIPGKDWYMMVADFSRRDLTYWTDRLPAFSGVASRFQRGHGSAYLAGLWASDFPRCLAWQRRELHDSPRWRGELCYSPNNQVPSWSWASVCDRVQWANFDDSGFDLEAQEPNACPDEVKMENCVEPVSVYCLPSTGNPFGEVLSGSYLALRGKVVEAELVCDMHGCGLVRRKELAAQLAIPDCRVSTTLCRRDPGVALESTSVSNSRHDIASLQRATHSAETSSEREGERLSGSVHCLLLFTAKWKERTPACVLIVSPHPEHEGTFQRLGIGHGDFGLGSPLYSRRKNWLDWKDWEHLEEWENWEEWFADAETRELRVA